MISAPLRTLAVAATLAVELCCCTAEPPPAAPASTVLVATTCAKTVSGLAFAFDLKRLRGGDNFVTCEIRNGAAQFQSSNYFKPGPTGKASTSCLVAYDVDEPTSGFWNFDFKATLEVRYSDFGSKSDGFVVKFSGQDCADY